MWGACAGAAFAAAVGLGATAAEAATAAEINTKVDAAIAKCYAEITGCKALGHKSVGMLVFPDVTKAAIGVGGSYGEGALRVGGKTTAYYSTSSASIGLSIGAQESSQIIMFLTQAALEDFRNSSGWEIGANASVAVIDTGKSGSFDSETVTDPVVGFIFGETGLMADLSLKGAKIKKIEP
jgi:lipid-binding SYLF domain-containing protein